MFILSRLARYILLLNHHSSHDLKHNKINRLALGYVSKRNDKQNTIIFVKNNIKYLCYRDLSFIVIYSTCTDCQIIEYYYRDIDLYNKDIKYPDRQLFYSINRDRKYVIKISSKYQKYHKEYHYVMNNNTYNIYQVNIKYKFGTCKDLSKIILKYHNETLDTISILFIYGYCRKFEKMA